MSEGEFLDITEIKRQQAKDYECITNNGVAPPDQHKVKVTVNCEYLWRERERECEWERPHLITLKIIYNPSVHIIYVFHSIKKQCFFRHSCICSEYNSVGRGTGPQQMDLDWSRSWLVTALLLLLLLYCCQILQWSQTWRICLHTWVRPPSSAVKLWLFLQLPLSGTEMSTGEHQFQILLYLKTEMIVEGRCSFSKMFYFFVFFCQRFKNEAN